MCKQLLSEGVTIIVFHTFIGNGFFEQAQTDYTNVNIIGGLISKNYQSTSFYPNFISFQVLSILDRNSYQRFT